MKNAIRTFFTTVLFAAAFSTQTRIGLDKYHNHAEMTDYLTKITAEFSDVSTLYSIGKSVKGIFFFFTKFSYNTI